MFFSVLKHVSLWPSYQDQDGEQDEEYETEEQLQARILNAALEFVPLHGWSVEAVAAGAEVRRELGGGQTQQTRYSWTLETFMRLSKMIFEMLDTTSKFEENTK